MKFDSVNGPPGEFGSKALVCTQKILTNNVWSSAGWELTTDFFFSLEEVKRRYPADEVKWPVELYDNSLCYVPDASEMK